MLTKRIIPCLDVKDNSVVKGVKFKNHRIVGDILSLAKRYSEEGADELVFYDITASCEQRVVNYEWIKRVAAVINIPFCVAGGIRTLQHAEKILENGADKISINSPALENPSFITELASEFGQQCVVVGVDTLQIDNTYQVIQYTGQESAMINTKRFTKDWLQEVMDRGAGEIVLNCINSDGIRSGYDLHQIKSLQRGISIPLIASGGAGKKEHFSDLFECTNISAALAASVFHENRIPLYQLKKFLVKRGINVRYGSYQ